jgi:hypothetical protein
VLAGRCNAAHKYEACYEDGAAAAVDAVAAHRLRMRGGWKAPGPYSSPLLDVGRPPATPPALQDQPHCRQQLQPTVHEQNTTLCHQQLMPHTALQQLPPSTNGTYL